MLAPGWRRLAGEWLLHGVSNLEVLGLLALDLRSLELRILGPVQRPVVALVRLYLRLRSKPWSGLYLGRPQKPRPQLPGRAWERRGQDEAAPESF